MATTHFRAGELYASRSQVRAHYREFWKGILVRDGRVAIIQAYKGLARRVHYSDALEPLSMTLTYVGEGLKGDQALTRGNAALVEAARTGDPVDVFFDCGDIQLPCGEEQKFEKHFLAGGSWQVVGSEFRQVAAEGRKVWRFTLVPVDEETRRTLQSIFVTDRGSPLGQSLDADLLSPAEGGELKLPSSCPVAPPTALRPAACV